MGSIFSGPTVNNRATRNSLKKAQSASSNASSNINDVAQNASSSVLGTGNAYASKLINTGNAAAGGITSAVNQYVPGILAAGNAGADSLSQLSGNLNQYFTPLNFNAGGLQATYGPNGYTVSPDANRQALVNALYGGYNDAATAFGNLRSQWTPGESALRNAQLASIENARTANISDLRANLQKRAVLGSSFAQDAQTRANLDFENQKNNVISQTYLQELDAQHTLINDQYTAATNAVSSKINELNLEGNLGQQLTTQAQDLFKQAAQLKAQLTTDAAKLRLDSASNAASLGVQGMTAAGQLQTSAAANAGQIATGAAQNAGQLGVTGASNAGNIQSTGATNIANIQSQLAAEQAKIDAQAQAGAGSLIGSLALAPFTGGTSLFGGLVNAGTNLLNGNGYSTQGISAPSNGYFYTPGSVLSNYYPQGAF